MDYCFRSYLESPIGLIKIVANDNYLLEIEFIEQITQKESENNITVEAKRQLIEYLNLKRKTFNVPIKIIGSDFYQECMKALLLIPYGKTITYKEQAISIKKPTSYRAVGNANGKNKLPIIIPCHRVISSTDIGGYSGGIDKKIYLLNLEKINIDLVTNL